MAMTLSWETFLGRFNLSKDYQPRLILAEEKATATAGNLKVHKGMQQRE